MGALVGLFAQFFLGFSGIAMADEPADFHRTLAEYYAPAVIHQVGKQPKADIPIKYDFDGDQFADNNWDNLPKFDVSPAAYYEVIETHTHFFITYAFFHPRDYTNFFFCMPRVCHENDLEGAILTVRKDENLGKLEFVEALAHLSIDGGEKYFRYIGDSKHQRGAVERVVLRIEAGGHGVHVWDGDMPKKYEFYLPSDDMSEPSLPRPAVRYGLYPMSELWVLRGTETDGIDRIFTNWFDFKGENFEIPNLPKSFAGKKYGKGLASLPWGWGAFRATKGEWFLDPATWVKRKIKNKDNFSTKYVHHPYLNMTLAPADQQREPAGN